MLMNEELLSGGLRDLGISAADSMIRQFSLYADLLTDWNTRMNLTAITEPDAVAVRHFVDSAALLAACPLKEGASVIDVGSGAGFPGVVLKILRPDLSVTLLDSQRKRADFLRALTEALALSEAPNAPCEILHARAEDAAKDPRLRERFDLSCARAVAGLRILAELCLPFARTGGIFAAMKGPEADREQEDARRGISLLGGRISEVRDFTLSDSSRRSIVLIKKISQTSTKYPRSFAKITKAPL